MMILRAFFLLMLLIGPSPRAHAYERGLNHSLLMNSVPARIIRLEKKGRMPASVASQKADKREALTELDKKLPVGTYAIVKNSLADWNDRVVRVTARYEDGSRQVQLDDGKFARVAFNNLDTLSPETKKCCEAGGVSLCPGDLVWHPLPTMSFGVPEGKVTRIFENCSTVVRDGLEYIYEARQLGKAVDCAPQKSNVCVGKVVYVEGYRNGQRYQFEGPVTNVFSNGSVLVKTGLWLLPIDAATAIVQTDSLSRKGNRRPASAPPSTLERRSPGTIPVPTYPEIEPFDANDGPQTLRYRGLFNPLR